MNPNEAPAPNSQRSKIETKAMGATHLSDLGHFDLAKSRTQLVELLAAIGRTPQFHTYTKHDVVHIDALLKSTDWIIPESTFEALSTADALLITLSIYIHDLGMLVTRDEFIRREESSYPDFKSSILSSESDRGKEFAKRLEALPDDSREDFLYEEFVRQNHAKRIAAWVEQGDYQHLGVATEAYGIVKEIFRDLDPVVRADIGLIARSHHENDLDDLVKYPAHRSYSNEPETDANIAYACLILRTADLLHITKDRTPTIQAQLASPIDPLGQTEWKKQAAVRSVKPSATNERTIAVHARFSSPEGFFSLQEYLDYAEAQLQLSITWNEKARASSRFASNYTFSWDGIDRAAIEAQGFNPRQFQFNFDQQKVLDLLTGHTLYNDSSVALRELVQNSVDASRLHIARNGGEASAGPDVIVSYDTTKRELVVRDRGVGMSQRIVEEHFLKVGSSGYQSDEFKKQNPGYTPISRFGIGVLSAFMVADEVHVATKTVDEERGREVVLKSVHGRYLIKDIEAGSVVESRLGKHGTEIRVRLRAASSIGVELFTLLERWIIIPNCKVVAQVDGGPLVDVGFGSIEEALAAHARKVMPASSRTRVLSERNAGVSISALQVWDEGMKEWGFVPPGDGVQRSQFDEIEDAPKLMSAVCIQGIRVIDTTPGFSIDGPIMMLNVEGPDAPKTNVARSDLEAGPPLATLIDTVYKSFVSFLTDQIDEMTRNVSARFALRETSFLYRDATRSDRGTLVERPGQMRDVIRTSDLFVAERGGVDVRVNSGAVTEHGFLTVVGPAADSASRFLEWVPAGMGLFSLLQSGKILEDLPSMDMPLLADFQALFWYDSLLWSDFEPEKISSFSGGNSVLVHMKPRSGYWESENRHRKVYFDSYLQNRTNLDRRGGRFPLSLGAPSHVANFAMSEEAEFEGFDGIECVLLGKEALFSYDSLFSSTYRALAARVTARADGTAVEELAALIAICDFVGGQRFPAYTTELISSMVSWLGAPERAEWLEIESLTTLGASVADTRVWSSLGVWQRRRSDD